MISIPEHLYPLQRVAISGSHGLIGTALVAALRQSGCQVVRLVRTPPPANAVPAGAHTPNLEQENGLMPPPAVYFNPDAAPPACDLAALAGVDALIHLGGMNIAERPWSTHRKVALLRNRQDGSALMHQVAATVRPRVLIVASAVGYYGVQHDGECTERTAPGTGFAAELCQAIEAPGAVPGVRTVYARFGVVLSPEGGALAKLLPAFQWGVGGKLGTGSQPFPWVSLPDAVAALQHILATEKLTGPVNIVSPNPVTNSQFAQVLGKVLRRPAVCALPAAVVKVLFGQMGEELLLNGQSVLPQQLEFSGFQWQHPKLEQSLRAVLKSVY